MNASAALKSTTWRSASTVWRIWGAGPPVILLHGGYGSWTHWLRTIPALTGKYTVLVPDMPGFGDSENPTLDNALEAIPGALLGGLETLIDINHGINIVGFSFGTVMAGQLAKLMNEVHPGKLLSLTFIAPAGLGFVTRSFEDLTRPRPDMSIAERREMHRKNLGIVMISDTSKITDETIDLQFDNAARARVYGKPYSRSDALLRACAGLPLPQVDAIWGSKDSYALRNEPDYSVSVKALHPDIRVHHIDGAGHWVQYEKPQQLNSVLLDCLETR
ncbi:alpha/beta fold hydrolase [Sneathiella sp.]|uniref:alpha/beta fold hydrolase n=1 Tax=Sneathiella sp. TaxID=1964365 RepID=UPI00356323A7